MPNDISASVKTADECSVVERAVFLSLVLQGGEVDKKGLPGRIQRAKALLFLVHPRCGLIGISALKHPERSYRAKVFRASGTTSPATLFSLELGWIYLLEEHRGDGFSSWLINPLLDIAADRPVFATCRTNNDAMNFILPKHGFRRSGEAYPSANGQHLLSLFVRR
ncbi:MAG TPA: hypothetical protein VGI60_10180 [Chthoniobacterales bacterium]|jgi:GNAT superfamily N-acetyltransferase